MSKNKMIIEMIRDLASMQGKTLSKEMLLIYVAALGNLSVDELTLALTLYLRSADSRFFPMPGQLYALARPEDNPEHEAQSIVDQIFAALGPCGTDAVGVERARTKAGSVGWQYIESLGGWPSFVSSVSYNNAADDIPTLKSQARKSIQLLLSRAKTTKREEEILGAPVVSLESLGIKLKEISHACDPSD